MNTTGCAVNNTTNIPIARMDNNLDANSKRKHKSSWAGGVM